MMSPLTSPVPLCPFTVRYCASFDVGSPATGGSVSESDFGCGDVRQTCTEVGCGMNTSYRRTSVSSPIAFICAIT